MLKNKIDISGDIRQILNSRLTGVLATESEEGPWTTLVSFCPSQDMHTLWFATSRVTRKFSNLNSNNNVAILFDTRTNSVDDFYDASALTATGEAKELQGQERDQALEMMSEKLRFLSSFLKSPSVAIIQVKVRKYVLVTSFQEVRELKLYE